MKNIFLSLLFIFVTACASAPVQPSPSPALPTTTSLPTLTPTPIPWEWIPSGALNFDRNQHTATLLLNGAVLVTGGYAEIEGEPDSELYDPVTGNWKLAGHPKKFRLEHTATLLPNGQVLVVGGANLSTLRSAELYDPQTSEWRFTAKMAVARQAHTATLLPNGGVLVVGGTASSVVEVYNPGTETWSETGSLNLARSGHTATLLANGKVLVVGGHSNSTDLTSAEVYDLSTGTWSETGSLNLARSGHTATLLPNGQVLVAGGMDKPDNSAELYDPVTEKWSFTGSLHVARRNHTATLLPTGDVLVVGGLLAYYYSDPALPGAEIYDPLTGWWKVIADPKATRVAQTATLLTNGTVLITGGLIALGSHRLHSSELYAPTDLNPSATAVVPITFPTPNASQLPLLPAPTATTPPTPQLTPHQWIPEAVLVEYGNRGGDGNFGPYFPKFILYADGRLIFDQGSEPFFEKQLERPEICALLNTVEQSGFFDYDPDEFEAALGNTPFLGDGGPDTILHVNAWRSKQISMPGLSIADDPSAFEMWDDCADCSDTPAIPYPLRDVYRLVETYRPEDAHPYHPWASFPKPNIPQPTFELSCTPEDGVIAISEP